VALPDLIEIVPLDKPVQARVSVPGSKSITNRALILAALAEGETTVQGALWSEDTQVMVDCLQELGFMVNVEPDLNEVCNRTITVYGRGGVVPPGGSEEQPVELFVGNAGTAARFLAPLVCLGKGVYRLHGTERMHQRPQAALFQALRELGYRVEAPNDKLPALLHGAGPRPGKCRISIVESSQFASALILCSVKGRWKVETTGENAEESPYVKMTDNLVATFPHLGGAIQIEPDASSGSYFLAAGHLLYGSVRHLPTDRQEMADWLTPGPSVVSVAHWPTSGWQVDQRFSGALLPDSAQPGASPSASGLVFEHWRISRLRDLGDSIMTAIVLAPFAMDSVRFTDLGRLRLQECERVTALRTELTRCGAKVIETEDSLEVFPSPLHGAEIETYNDHRMAMCFAILGLKIPGIKLKNPSCVKKTFPDFFQKLNAPPPRGLGTLIRDARTGRALVGEELFAE
jgi:3-phosphoshikimate 1-carboxyvinyltransferase